MKLRLAERVLVAYASIIVVTAVVRAQAVPGNWGWRPLGVVLVLPVLLMPVATVYCQMHYAVDALAGVALGIVVPWAAARLDGT